MVAGQGPGSGGSSQTSRQAVLQAELRGTGRDDQLYSVVINPIYTRDWH